VPNALLLLAALLPVLRTASDSSGPHTLPLLSLQRGSGKCSGSNDGRLTNSCVVFASLSGILLLLLLALLSTLQGTLPLAAGTES